MRRVGSLQERKVNVRLLAATNRNLAAEVKAGRFREDLYYRINVLSLELPPLRERTGDIPLLIERLLGPGWELDPAARERLETFSWPGNIRQLANALERAKIVADDHIIHVKDLPREVATALPDTNGRPVESLTDDLASIQRQKIVEVLRRVACNKSRAAKALGIDRRKLYRLLERYNISDGEIHSSAAGSSEVSQPPQVS
jgi:transcriptional regulator with PAS, ATPase and Fis domain